MTFFALVLLGSAIFVRFSREGRVLSGEYATGEMNDMYMPLSGKFLKIWVLIYIGIVSVICLLVFIMAGLTQCMSEEKIRMGLGHVVVTLLGSSFSEDDMGGFNRPE